MRSAGCGEAVCGEAVAHSLVGGGRMLPLLYAGSVENSPQLAAGGGEPSPSGGRWVNPTRRARRGRLPTAGVRRAWNTPLVDGRGRGKHPLG